MIHVLITTFILAQPAGQTAASDAIKKYLQRCEQVKAEAIKEREAALKALTGIQLAGAQAALKRFQDAPARLLPLPIPPAKDDVGVFVPPRPTDARHGRSLDVLEVVGPEDFILRVWYPLPGSAPTDDPTFLDLWVHGLDTSRLTAGTNAEIPQVFRVAGNKLFDTTCGKRSMVLLEVVEVEKYRTGRP